MGHLNLLLVEDNEMDIIITNEILEQNHVSKTLHVVSTAEEGISYVNNICPFQQVQKPDLILLDINLPYSDGFGVLVEVKSNPALSSIPVVILTSSTCQYDQEFAMKNGADCYMEKPLDMPKLKSFLEEWENSLQTAVSI